MSRSIVMQSLYEWDFYGKKQKLKEIVERNLKNFGVGLKDKSFVCNLAEGVERRILEIDEIIRKAAPQWPIEQIAIVDRNVLRIGLYELLYSSKKAVPPKVAINEDADILLKPLAVLSCPKNHHRFRQNRRKKPPQDQEY